MYEYFKMIEQIAKSDPTEYSIKDLTIKLAKGAGYYRGQYTFRNGTVRERTMYSGKFDDVLSAKWLMHYKKLFISRLRSHPEFGDGAVDIINNTFTDTMRSIKLDAIVEDDVINMYVNLTLVSRIKNYLVEIGSAKRLDEYNSGKKLNMRLSKYLANQALSLDALSEDSNFDVADEVEDNAFSTDVESRLADNPFGLRLLDAMLSAKSQIHLSRIDEYMPMSESEKTDDNRYLIKCAYVAIKDTLRKSVANRHMYDFGAVEDESVGFSEGKTV